MERPAEEISFDWDEGNVAHLARHRIRRDEVEECFRNDPVLRSHETVKHEDRWTVVGATSALRVLVLVFTLRDQRIRPVTAWDAERQTKRDYFREKGSRE